MTTSSTRKNARWLFFLLLLALSLSSCGETTPKGVLVQKDFRPSLPAAVAAKAPADDQAEKNVAEFLTPDSGASVVFTWRYFKDGPNSYLLSVAGEVTRPEKNTKLSASVSDSPNNVGTPEAVRQALEISVNWQRAKLFSKDSGTLAGTIYSDGQAKEQK